MKLKSIFGILILTTFASSTHAMSVSEAFHQVETRWSQLKRSPVLHRAFTKHIKQSPIASISEDDIYIFKSLVADDEVTSLELNCQADLADSYSESLGGLSGVSASHVCEKGVKHIYGYASPPRILNLTYANGEQLQVTVGLKKPASGFCSPIANQLGLYLTSVNSGMYEKFNKEETHQFHTSETTTSSIINASQTERLGMALYRCCQPVDNKKENCLERVQEALKAESPEVMIKSR